MRFDGKEFLYPPAPTGNAAWDEIMNFASTAFDRKGVKTDLKLKLVSDHFPVWAEF